MERAKAFWLLGIAVSPIFFASGTARAQDTAPAEAQPPATPPADKVPSGNELPDIIVTAQKRSENVQNTALAVTALTADDLEKSKLNSVESVFAAVPNVQFSRSTGNARIAIRGLGYDSVTVGGEARVAYHVDGVYMSRPTSVLGSFYDVSRVEVLRGPQGTLYGRNTTAGAINVITQDPTDKLSGYASLLVGNYDLIEGKGAISGPVSDTISARLAFDVISRGGYGKNNVTGQDVDNERTQAVRGKIKFEPSSTFRAILSADYLHENDNAFGLHYMGDGGYTAAGVPIVSVARRLGATPPANPRDIDINYGPYARRELWGGSLNLSWDIGRWTITSLSAYRHTEYRTISDLASLPGGVSIYNQTERSRQFSEELRLSGKTDWADFTLGGFYFNEKIDGSSAIPLRSFALGQPLPDRLLMFYWAGGRMTTNAGAAFGQVDFHILPQLTFSVGARYSSERKTIDESQQLDTTRTYSPTAPIIPFRSNSDGKTWSSFDPKATLEFRPVKGVLAYATYSQAFKSGGFNLGGFQAPFNPERLTSYEVGLKADLFDRHLRTNISLFHYDYKDLQVSIVNGTVVTIVNAATARVQGIEAEIEALPFDHFRLQATGALLDGKYRSFRTADPSRPDLGVQNLAGNRLTQSPPYTFTFAAEYDWDLAKGNLSLRGEVSGIGRVYFGPFERRDTMSNPYVLSNAYLTYKDSSGWSGSLFVRNLTDKLYRTSVNVGSGLVGFPLYGTYGPPRTYGVELRYDF